MFLTCLILLAGFSNVQAQTRPTQSTGIFRPSDNLFTIAFPTTPSVAKDSLPSSTGAPYQRMTYSYQSNSNMLRIGVLYISRGQPVGDDEQAALLEASVKSLIDGMPAFVPDKNGGVSNALLDGHYGKRIQGINNGAGVYAALYATPRHLFVVQGYYDPGNPAAKTATEAFVNSLKITD